jgi:general secretion pathway protein M
MAGVPAALGPVIDRWQALEARERLGVLLAVGAVAAFIAWSVLLAPALKTLREAPAQERAIQAQMDRMLQWQAHARTLQSRAALDPQSATAALQNATALLGPTARLQVQGDQATLTVQGCSAAALAAWLAQMQSSGGLQPTQARLQRSGTAPNMTWSGSVLFQLPAAAPR